MTNGQAPRSGTPMEEADDNSGGVSGMMNLNINLPDNLRLVAVDSDETEETEVASAIVTGSIIAFAGGTAPDGWLLCNGAAISRATYADLFAVIGTDYGLGNANTTFNLPDFRGRFMLGLDNMGGVSADRVADSEADILGGESGEATVTLKESELPPHAHDVLVGASSSPGSDPGEDELATGVNAGSDDRITGFSLRGPAVRTSRYPKYARNPDSSGSGYAGAGFPNLIQGGGGTDRHYNMPPYQTVNYIIKT